MWETHSQHTLMKIRSRTLMKSHADGKPRDHVMYQNTPDIPTQALGAPLCSYQTPNSNVSVSNTRHTDIHRHRPPHSRPIQTYPYRHTHTQTYTQRHRHTERQHRGTQRNRGEEEGWGRGKAGSSERQTLRPRSAKLLLRVYVLKDKKGRKHNRAGEPGISKHI